MYHLDSFYKKLRLMKVNIGGQLENWGVGAHPINGTAHLLPQWGITESTEYHHFNDIILIPFICILL